MDFDDQDFRLVTKWADVNSEAGLCALETGDRSVAVFDPADHPPFDPRTANKFAGRTNCYAYTLNALGEFFNPGAAMTGRKSPLAALFNRHSGIDRTFQELVREGLEMDGILPVRDGNLYRPGYYLIANFLCLNPIDFHFMRLNSNGQWSQVFFRTPMVSWSDASGEPIQNPATAIMKSTTNFQNFYHVPKGGILALRDRQP